MNLKALRIQKGHIKAYEFANKVGITRQYLSMLETGKAVNPSMKVVRKIASELDVSPQEIYFGEE